MRRDDTGLVVFTVIVGLIVLAWIGALIWLVIATVDWLGRH